MSLPLSSGNLTQIFQNGLPIQAADSRPSLDAGIWKFYCSATGMTRFDEL